jgi:flagellar protein FlbD
VIAVTCRNGEHFSIDPDAIERVEAAGETVVHMVDGSKYVVDQGLDELVAVVRDHRAAAFVARTRLVDGLAATPAAARHARRVWAEHRPITSLADRSED